VLRPPGNLRFDAELPEALDHQLPHVFEIRLELGIAFRDVFPYLVVVLRVEDPEGEVLELARDARHAEPPREGGVYVQRLPRDPQLVLRRLEHDGPHIVELVGELDDNDTHVLDRGDQHLAERGGLGVRLGPALDRGYLRNAVHQPGYLLSERLFDHVKRGAGVFDRVVEQGGRYGAGIELQAGKDDPDLEGVDDVWLAGKAELALMGRAGEEVGLLYHRQVVFGVDPPDGIEQGGNVPAAYFQLDVRHISMARNKCSGMDRSVNT